LFSTDHSKPINTLTGGLLVTKDAGLAAKVREIQAAAADLPAWKQNALWARLLFERELCNPSQNGSVALRDMIGRATTPRFKRPFLDQDFGVLAGTQYPYPAQMPPFLAAVGIAEVQRWNQTASERKTVLRSLLDAVDSTAVEEHIPQVYRNPRLDIVPLRLAWTQTNGAAVRASLSGFIDVSWTWFLQPLIATKAPLESYLYRLGSCPTSEHAGPGMVNLPCNVSSEFVDQLIIRSRAVLCSIRQ
jgi:perosamine synthetase